MSFQSGRIAGPVMLIAAFLSTVHPNIKLDTELLFFLAKWPPPASKSQLIWVPPHHTWAGINGRLINISCRSQELALDTALQQAIHPPSVKLIGQTLRKNIHTNRHIDNYNPHKGFLSFEDNSSVTLTCPFAVVQIVTPAWWRYILHISVHIQWSVSYSASLLLPVQKKCIERSEGGCCTKLLNLSQIWWSGR